MQENQHLGYKQKLTSNSGKERFIFLNNNEVYIIYIGINNKRNAVSIPNIDQAQLTMKDSTKNNILPSCLGLFNIIAEE